MALQKEWGHVTPFLQFVPVAKKPRYKRFIIYASFIDYNKAFGLYKKKLMENIIALGIDTKDKILILLLSCIGIKTQKLKSVAWYQKKQPFAKT